MENVTIAAFVWLLFSTPAWACPSTTTTQNTMAIQSPCVDTIITYNQVTAPFASNAAVSDANMVITGSATFPVMVRAPGMQNVEVRTHGALAKRLTSDGVGGFSGTVNTLVGDAAGSCQPVACEGPMLWEIDAWNAPPGGAYTVHLKASFNVWNHTGHWWPVATYTPVGAAGMHLAFRERFGDLEATACKPGTGIWPNCAKPSAGDINPTTGKPYLYYTNLPEGGDFGNAAMEHMDGAHNPFNTTGVSGTMPAGQVGVLRVRSQHHPAFPGDTWTDPYGFGRFWSAGEITTMFPDRTSNVPHMTNGGYCEIRAMTPGGAGASGNANNSGGTWWSFWMVDRNGEGTPNNLEFDITEQYAIDSTKEHVNRHNYGATPGPDAAIYFGQPTVPVEGLEWDFHRYGLKWNGTSAQAYFDDKPVGTLQAVNTVNGQPYDPFLVIDMNQGGGWHSAAPPSGYYDLWVDDWECYVP